MPYDKLKAEHYQNNSGIDAKGSRKVVDSTHVLDMDNYDFSAPGALTKRFGSTQYIGATLVGNITGFYEFNRLNGASYLVVTANTAAFAVQGNAFSPIAGNFTNPGIFSFVTFVDRLFMADGNNFIRSDGVNSYLYSLPIPGAPGVTITGTSAAGGLTGLIQIAYGFVNERGYFGPPSAPIGLSFANQVNFTITGISIPQGYGIIDIAVYMSAPDLTQLYLTSYPAGAIFPVGASLQPVYLQGQTLGYYSDAVLSSDLAPTYLWFTMTPQAIEQYNNQLFLMGFSNSTVFFSDIGEPEGVGSTFFFDVRTNDGDVVVGGKSYGPQLVIGKFKSCHQLTGTDPTNFLLTEISDQYGMVSKRAICTFNSLCWFLDEKGIVEYNGAFIQIVSNNMEPFFKRMNLAAAKQTAIMKHIKDRNEIWTIFPIDGATFNNMAVVYDYLSQGWTKYYGFFPSALDTFYGATTQLQVGFGDYSGAIHSFGHSCNSDDQHGITCSFLTVFQHDMGNSVEKMFRRLYVDIDPSISGATRAFEIDFFTDQGTTAAQSMTFIVTSPQSRLDFGLSAKDIAIRICNQENSPLRINGYTIEYRFQRAV
jgi:hypothetical protein